MFILNKIQKKYYIDKNNAAMNNLNIRNKYYIKDTKTIFVYNLNLNINEILLFNFFSHDCSIIDVKLIKDKISFKSKGLAYIEVIDQKDITNALSLTGKTLVGNNLMIKASESEKNLAWEIQMNHLPEFNSSKEHFRVLKYLSYYSNDFYSNIMIKNLNFYIKEQYIHKLLDLFGHLITIKITNLELDNLSFSVIASFNKKLNLNRIFKKLNGIIILDKSIQIKIIKKEIRENLEYENIIFTDESALTSYSRSQIMNKRLLKR
ncbi:splicing factor cc1-like protein (nucleomorph) [Lotharella oceanica]|uniref:Splicing factor cc1-like protein n=1 Tax=Lotharella oceanica TaxID=641309 RepID=A0A060DHH7_9EUKA|nr:splicing factor cc1-like protein [Lotharella oceanica]